MSVLKSNTVPGLEYHDLACKCGTCRAPAVLRHAAGGRGTGASAGNDATLAKLMALVRSVAAEDRNLKAELVESILSAASFAESFTAEDLHACDLKTLERLNAIAQEEIAEVYLSPPDPYAKLRAAGRKAQGIDVDAGTGDDADADDYDITNPPDPYAALRAAGRKAQGR